MNIRAYKGYRFSHGTLTATDTGKEYLFSININDCFYHYMEKYIIKEKVEGLSYETIDKVSVKDIDKTFFDEKSFVLNAVMLVTDKSDCVHSYLFTMKNVKITSNKASKKKYSNGCWELEMYDLEIPYQTYIYIVEMQE